MKHSLLYLVLICTTFFSTYNSAAQESVAQRSKVAKSYTSLKAKTDSGQKVRIISRVKDVGRAHTNRKVTLQAFQKARTVFEKQGLVVQRELPRLGLTVMEVDSAQLDELIDSGLVETVEEDFVETPHLVQSIEHIGANLAHASGFTGANQAIVVIDTGVEFWHPFFGERLVEEACFSSNTSDASTLCPNGQETQFGLNAANDCSPSGILGCDHGTHVAGIALGANAWSTGVAPDANLVAVQAFSAFSASACENQIPCVKAYAFDILAALDWVLNDATTDNIAVVNMSLGGGKFASACDSDLRAQTIEDLRAAGIATVISSGNNGFDDAVAAPGCISAAITVGSTLPSSDAISTFSNSAAMVDILAPGSSITSSVTGGGYGPKSGTSMAAPHVAGAFAVMRSINPNASVDDIEQSLEDNGVPILDASNNLTFPRLDLNAATASFDGTPIASLDSGSYSVIVGQEATFTAFESSDPNGLPLTYIWNFGDGVGDYQTTAANVQHTYEDTGSYSLTVSATNGTQTSDPSDAALVTVYDPVILTVIVNSILL